MPSQRHEQAAQLLGLFVTRLAEELETPYEPLGMTTWKMPGAAKGLEADQCYYIQHHAVAREKEILDLETDPPPDLAVEVDITSSSLDRMGIYGEMRVPEVWRYDGRAMTIYYLAEDTTEIEASLYVEQETSAALPMLTAQLLTEMIERMRNEGELKALLAFDEWLQSQK